MVDMNIVIGRNINHYLTQKSRKQTELANFLGVPRQTVNKMINGARMINAAELKQIAEFCNTTMEALTTIPPNYEETDVLHVFMGQVKTEAARETIKDIDVLIDLVLFHSRVKENGEAMLEELEDL